MKLIFDDTTYTVELKTNRTSVDLIKCTNGFQFDDLIKILLTKSQLDRFIVNYTHRTFDVSDKKYLLAEKCMKNNIWNHDNDGSTKKN